MRSSRLLAAIALAIALVLSACGGSDGESAAVDTSPDTAEAAPTEQTESARGSLVASTVDGGQIDFGSLEGQDVVLWFWAPW